MPLVQELDDQLVSCSMRKRTTPELVYLITHLSRDIGPCSTQDTIKGKKDRWLQVCAVESQEHTWWCHGPDMQTGEPGVLEDFLCCQELALLGVVQVQSVAAHCSEDDDADLLAHLTEDLQATASALLWAGGQVHHRYARLR